jgi:hypothetical protein
VEGKYSLFPKWGSFYKHVSDKKVEKEYWDWCEERGFVLFKGFQAC